jgi:hypothetical protein
VGVDVGILISKATNDEKESKGETTRWMVSVVGGSEDEEMVSEKMLGRVLAAQESDDSSRSATMKSDAKNNLKKAGKETTKFTSDGPPSRRMNTRAASKKGGAHTELVTGLDSVRNFATSPRPKKKQGDETVIEVKMRTGTLFLYRGKTRRAEFIYRV